MNIRNCFFVAVLTLGAPSLYGMIPQEEQQSQEVQELIIGLEPANIKGLFDALPPEQAQALLNELVFCLPKLSRQKLQAYSQELNRYNARKKSPKITVLIQKVEAAIKAPAKPVAQPVPKPVSIIKPAPVKSAAACPVAKSAPVKPVAKRAAKPAPAAQPVARRKAKARVVPLALHPVTKKVSVLLRLYNDPDQNDKALYYWRDFYENVNPDEAENEAAARALATQTNGEYNIAIASELGEETPYGDTVYFVPVPFKAGKYLYERARNDQSEDFVWVSAEDILSDEEFISRVHRVPRPGLPDEEINYILAVGVRAMLKQYLPDVPSNAPAAVPHVPPVKPVARPRVPAAVAQQSWWGLSKDQAIYFYDKHKQSHYEFTNFWPVTLRINGLDWPTSEHYYQAQKFVGTPVAKLSEQIRSLGTDRMKEVWRLGQNKQQRPDWRAVNIGIMLKALREKFSDRHPELKKKLWDTGEKILVEDARGDATQPADPFFGAGADGQGRNYLGQLLMHVRKELHAKQILPYTLYETPEAYFRANPLR